jgi:integrase
MNFKVAQLGQLDKPTMQERELLSALGDDAEQPGIYYILNDQTQEIFEPAWLYLKAKYGKTGLAEASPDDSRISNRIAAYSLAAWLNFVAAMKKRWSNADHNLMLAYARFQVSRTSAHTGTKRDPNTIGAKFSVIHGFYRYMNATGLTNVSWDAPTIRAQFRTRRPRRAREDEKIRPISPENVARMRSGLGKLPSELFESSELPCRDRLLFETGLLTGMRGEEICFLPLKAILSLKPDTARPDALYPVRITVTKNRKPRSVMLPGHLVQELQAYAAKERKQAIGKRRSSAEDHGYLFVNSPDSSKPGEPLKTNTIHRRFSRLMKDLNLCERVLVTKSGEQREVLRNLHTFHDTRHTFAVTSYIAYKSEQLYDPRAFGISEPWELVQIALGHEDFETTKKYYLRHVGEYVALIGLRVSEFFGEG